MQSLLRVREEVDAATADAGRELGSARVVAVSKSFPVEAIADAYADGQREFGESRAQELIEKAHQSVLAGMKIEWHFIGRLQTNKVKHLAPFVAVWQSVDRPELAEHIANHAPGARVLLQMRLGTEATKGGCDPTALEGLLGTSTEHGLNVEGLMGIAPRNENPTKYFDTLVTAADRLGLPERSIGMSGDFREAIRCGATIVRIGSGIFGSRPQPARLA